MEESRSSGERLREVNFLNKRAVSNYIVSKNIERYIRPKYSHLCVESELFYAILTLMQVPSSVGGGTLRYGRDSLFPNVASVA